MDARRAPEPVRTAHFADEIANLCIDFRSAATSARLPTPICAEPGPGPADHGVRLDDRDGVGHLRAQSVQHAEDKPTPTSRRDRRPAFRTNTLTWWRSTRTSASSRALD